MESVALKETIERAAELAWKYEREYGGCAQVVLAAIRETIGHVGDDVFQAATGLAGGLGRTGHACGALVGGVMALSCFRGRPYDDFPDSAGRRPPCLAMSKKLVEAFQDAYGSADCHGIHRKLLGRSYDLSDPGDFEQFIKDGGHDDKCTSVCANSVRQVIGILNEEGLI
ncbi:MAG: C-GCAxxG-C-C family protein [Synergistaceae bacterium]|jgi:C_GCAxxG_C_C family probable redox protein|nr:C-GCAxxG-C-C family protein [Synergistaceae bacterium]